MQKACIISKENFRGYFDMQAKIMLIYIISFYIYRHLEISQIIALKEKVHRYLTT